MSSPPSTCTNYAITSLSTLKVQLSKSPHVVTILKENYSSLGLDQNINAFNYLLGFQYKSLQASFFFTEDSFSSSVLDTKFSPTFMFQAWSIKSNVRALSQLILSLEGISSGTGTDIVPQKIAQPELYNFWNSYMDFVFYQFFCINTGLTTSPSNTTSSSAYINLKGGDDLLLEVNNLHALLLTSENGGAGLGTGGAGTKRLCQFCTDFWGSDQSNIRKTIVSNPGINKFCGCCTGIPLLDFGTAGPGGKDSSDKQPPIRCQPICSGPHIVKSYAGSNSLVNNGGDLSYLTKGNDFYSANSSGFFFAFNCPNQTICIMDKLNIQVAGFNAKLDFNQVCPGCGGGECLCFIDSGSNVIENMAANGKGMSDPVVFNQKCGNGAFCFNVQGDGTRVQVKCNNNNTSNTSKHPDLNYNGSGKVNFLNSIVSTNAYTYGLDNIMLPLLFFSIIIFYLLLTTIDTVSHIKRVFKMKRLDE